MMVANGAAHASNQENIRPAIEERRQAVLAEHNNAVTLKEVLEQHE